MNIRIARLVTLSLFAVGMQCFAQAGTGRVTFYSRGFSGKERVKFAIVPVGTMPFTGWLFDGDQKLAHAQRQRFMTFERPAGEHRFTVPYSSNHPGKTPLILKIEDGGHYCVRLSARYKSASILAPIAFANGQIEQVSCEQALKEAGNYKKIDAKRVDPAIRPKLDQSVSFPNEK